MRWPVWAMWRSAGRYAEAADYLTRAAQLGGDQSQQRQQQAADARFTRSWRMPSRR